MRTIKLFTILLVLLLPFFLSNRTGFLPVAGRVVGITENQLIYGQSRDAVTLDPAWAEDDHSHKVIANIFEGLVRFQPGTNTIEPCLAEGWRVSADGREWTFFLRKGVKFHDGTPFNSDAVRFSVERQLPPQRTANNGYASFTFGMLESIRTPDQFTVQFILKYPYAPFLNNLAMPAAAPIVSPTAAAALGEEFGENPVGTGPYRFSSWKKGKNIILKENRDYWHKLPACPTLVFSVIKHNRLRALALGAGFVDIVDNLTPGDARYLEQKGYPVIEVPGQDLSYLGFFTDKKPFDNPAVRRAISMLIDKKHITELYKGGAIEANGPLPPGVLGYNANLHPLPYDPAGARELLAGAGYGEGLEFEIITYTNTRPYNPAGGDILATAIQKELALAGVHTSIKSYNWEEYKEALLNEEGNAFLYGWIGDNGDGDNFLYTLLSSTQIENGLNTARYRNYVVDLLLAKAQRESEPALRERMYHEALEIITREAPWVFLNHSLRLYATSTTVTGFTPHCSGFTPLDLVKNN